MNVYGIRFRAIELALRYYETPRAEVEKTPERVLELARQIEAQVFDVKQKTACTTG